MARNPYPYKGVNLTAFVRSLVNRWTGAGLTEAENQANAFTASMARETNAFNAAEAEKNREFQAEMANTTYQRSAADMQAAGVNPALAISGGVVPTPSGSAASGVSASSVSPAGASMSDLMQIISLPKQLKLLDKQIADKDADIAKKSAETGRIQEETKWIPLMNASQLDLNAGVLEKYASEVESLTASTEGQRLANEWNPKLWQNDLDNGRVNRNSTIVAISKMQQEIQNLIAQEGDIYAGIDLKHMQTALAAAQIGLVNANTANVSAETWSKQMDNAFRELTGYKPDQPVWNAVTSVLGESGEGIKKSLRNLGDNLKRIGKGNFLVRDFQESHHD